jgi:hypothetical protein
MHVCTYIPSKSVFPGSGFRRWFSSSFSNRYKKNIFHYSVKLGSMGKSGLRNLKFSECRDSRVLALVISSPPKSAKRANSMFK